MIVINEFVYSLEMWEWFHDMKRNELDFKKSRDSSVEIFEKTYFTQERYQWPREYYKLNLYQFWDILSEIFMWVTGVTNNNKVDVKFTHCNIASELDKIYRCMLWWCFAQGLEESDFGNFDYTMVDKEKMSVNQHFRYRVYYMIRAMKKSFSTLETFMLNSKKKNVCDMQEIEPYSYKNDLSKEQVLELILTEIKKSAAGDADEFILYTISNIQNITMNDEHEKICQLVRFIKFENPDFTTKLPPGQIWQTLFESIFDGKDEVFGDFFEAFPSESIIYFLSDYALNTFGINRIPMYNIFTEDKGQTYSKDILNLLDTTQIKKRIRQVIKKYEQT